MAGIEEAFEKFVTRVSGQEEPRDEYGDPQTGEKRIPLMQGIKRGYDFENTMPNYYNQRYNYENEMPMYQDDRYNIPQQELMGGGIASMFSQRPGYAEGGSLPNSATAPSGIEYELFYSPFSGKPLYRPKYDPSRTDLVYSGTDPEEFFKTVMSTGTSIPTTTEMFPTISYDPIGFSSGNPNQKIVTKEILDQTFGNNPYTNTDLYNRFGPEISMQLEGNFPTTNEVPTIDPFSGQQVSMQDQMAFTQPQADIFPQQNIPQPPSPVDQFIGERRFQAEADAAARSGIPFTKKIQDYLPNIGFNVPGHMDYFNQIREAGLPTSEYHRLGTADLVQRNIDQLPSILKPIAGAIAPVTALTMSIPYELTQASQRMEPGSGIGGFYNTYMNESPFSAASNRFIGAAQPLANQIQNLLSPVANSAQRSQQEAAARVTPRMTMMYGGLTNTIPPDSGPDPQGVESLFTRRYN